MLRNCALVALLCIGCGESQTPGTDPGGDAAPSGDGRLPIVDELTCDTHLRTTVEADGDRIEQRTYFVVVSGLSPTDNFRIEQCDPLVDGLPPVATTPCPTGSTCTDSGPTVPQAKCFWSANGGAFTADGKLVMNCGFGTKRFNAAGVLQSESDFRSFTILRVHH